MSNKKTILLLAANPKGTERIDVYSELRELQKEIEHSLKREDFLVKLEPAVRYEDLERSLLEFKPYIFHFCGHGAGKKGLVLEGENGEESFLKTKSFTELVRILTKDRCECILLNACYTEHQAKEIAKYVNYVIGMKTGIFDDLAITYSLHFYKAIGAGESIDVAHDLGCFNLKKEIENNPEKYNCYNSDNRAIYDPDPDDKNFFKQLIPIIWHEKNTENDESIISKTARQGLYDLASLMSNPLIYATLQSGKEKLQEVQRQIEVINNYKDLHDQLHDLELHCYRMISLEIDNFPNDFSCLSRLGIYEQTLAKVINDINEISDRPTLKSEKTQWIQELEDARRELQSAIEEKNAQKLTKSQRILSRIIAIQPNHIDSYLKNSAEALNLQMLSDYLTKIQNSLGDLDNKKQQIQENRKALEQMVEILQSRINEHYKWQDIDIFLRMIDEGLIRDKDIDIDELVDNWTYLKGKVEKQYVNYEEEWARNLKECSEKFDNLLKADILDFSKIKYCFLEYRSKAINRFFQIDCKLKEFCKELSKFSQPLSLILEKIG